MKSLRSFTIRSFTMSLVLLVALSYNQAWGYTVKLIFESGFGDSFQSGQPWANVNQNDVKNLIIDKATADFSPQGISVSTTTGNATVYIGRYSSPGLFGYAVTGIGSYQDTNPSPYCEVYSNEFAKYSEWQGSNATAERISNAIAKTASHEAGHLINLYHAYTYNTFDPMVPGTLGSTYQPKEPDQLPSSVRADPLKHEHLMVSLAYGDITLEQYATINGYFSTPSDNILRFAVQGGKNIDINTTWGLNNRTFNLQNDVAISSGKTLIIAAGGYTHNMNGRKMTGTIQKYGTITPDISLQNNGIKGQFSTVQSAINAGSSGDAVWLAPGAYSENVTMRSGVHLKRSGSGTAYINGTVDFNTVSGIQINDIRFYGRATLYSSSNVNFTNCEFWAASTYAASVTNGTAIFFTNCDFWSSTDGLLLNNHDPFVDGCKLHGNTRYGINCTNGSEPDVTGANHLYENWSYEIRADNTCGNIYATDNYWNPVPPEVSHEGNPGAQIFVNPYYAHKPAIASVDDNPAAVTLRWMGQQLLREGKAAEALTYFQEIVASYPNSRSAQLAIGHVVSAYRWLGQEEQALSYLEDLTRRAQVREITALALFHTIPLLVELDKGTQALARTEELIQTYPGSRFERLGLFNKGFILAKRGDQIGRTQAFTSLIEKHPGTEEAAVAEAIIGASIPQAAKSKEALVIAPNLEPNHPNPFNPVTQIRFRLPRSERVQIDVYNIHGQLVRRLMNAEYPAGYHTVQWDSRDDTGKGVASGMYFYRLTAGAFTQTRKMLLLK